MTALASRIRAEAGTSRPGGRDPAGGLRLPPTYLAPGLLLDEGRQALRRQGEEVWLTPTEQALLTALITADGAVVPDEGLIAAAWGDGAAVAPQTLYVHASALRRKLGPAARLGRRYGSGYFLDLPPV